LSAEAKQDVAVWLEGWENEIAPRKYAVELVDRTDPDVVVVSPYVNFGSREVDFVKAARARGIPTVLAVASWDNLTNKGVAKVQPDYVSVWNRHMAREAMELHGVRSERIWITGSPVFDSWFGRQPSRDRATLCDALGFDPRFPILAYMCSSESIAGPHEDVIVRQWTSAIGRAEQDRLRGANMLVRPHPMNLERWRERVAASMEHAQSGRPGRAIVWPRKPKHPTTEEGRADFYDTLFHADAIVGLNTSAMIEAAILRKPILTFRGHSAETTQTGNQHFKYLTDNGLVIAADNLDSHVAQLASVLADPEQYRGRCDAFVADFIRPLGITTNASAVLARHLLEAAKVTPSRTGHGRSSA
jgi:hypothetical protein